MDRPVREHIAQLERLLEDIAYRLQTTKDIAPRNRLEAEFRAANLALEHYRKALEIEKSLPAKL